jgi:hypothetical protein
VRWYLWALLLWLAWFPILCALVQLVRAVAGRRRLRRATSTNVKLFGMPDGEYVPRTPLPQADAWAWDEDDVAAIICPACLRMNELHRQNPRLTVDQLDALVKRQIALGHCRAHSYADAPD